MRLAVLMALAGACGPAWDEREEAGLRVLTREAWPRPGGRVPVEFEVLPGESAALVAASVDAAQLGYMQRVTSPAAGVVLEASELWDDPHNRANGAFSSSVVVMNWPLDAAAEPLTPGRWRFDVQVDQDDLPVDVAVVLKQDDALDVGALGVDVVIERGLAADPELSRGIDEALARWRDDIYGPAGVELDVALVPSDIPTHLPAPGRGEEEVYEAIAAARDRDRISLVVVSTLDDGPLVLGVAGGIPGPLTPTRNAAVTVSAAEAAGRDLRFDDGEIELLAETMAHEVGHYLGLFHPVEIPRDGVIAATWDALADTPECAGFETDCTADLGDNLMFPSPVCTGGGALGCDTFLHQTRLSALQVALAQRYTGVR
ncbi:MAG TPA: hypothetical protein PKA64_17405 [Myxococcota bacterium]|nr:hypothetical protein [Myxococcota bacterium]